MQPINQEAWANIRFGAHSGLKSDIAQGPKSAQEQTLICTGFQTRHLASQCSALFLPVFPVLIIDFKVAGNGCADGREKVIFAKLCEQSESFQLVLDGIL